MNLNLTQLTLDSLFATGLLVLNRYGFPASISFGSGSTLGLMVSRGLGSNLFGLGSCRWGGVNGNLRGVPVMQDAAEVIFRFGHRGSMRVFLGLTPGGRSTY